MFDNLTISASLTPQQLSRIIHIAIKVKLLAGELVISSNYASTPPGFRWGCVKVGCPPWYVAIAMVAAGVPLTQIKTWMGHTSIQTTEIYLQASGEEAHEMMRRAWPD